MTPDQSLTQGLQFLTHWILVIALPLSGIGALSMALIQTAKNMLPLRRWFQRFRLEHWLHNRALRFNRAEPKPLRPIDASAAQRSLVHLATAGDSDAFYDLPIEQLCGQINASTQVILDYPALHWDLLCCLASEANPRDLNTLDSSDKAKVDDRKALFRKPANELTAIERDQLDEFVAARNRVSHQIQRAVDSLQISVGFRWKFWMQLASILLSAALGVAAVIIGTQRFQASLSLEHKLGLIVLTAVLSGLLAPVARDLVAAIEQMRT